MSRELQLEQIAALSGREWMVIRARQGKRVAMSETADKVQALLDTVQTLQSAGAAHALMGGVAVGFTAVCREPPSVPMWRSSRRRREPTSSG